MAAEVSGTGSRARRILIVVLAGVLFAGLAALGVWAASRPSGIVVRQTAIEPAESTATSSSPAQATTASAEGTAGASGNGGGTSSNRTGDDASASGDAEDATAPAAVARIAFTLGSRVYVANEDGSNAVAVAPAGGSYALSPDGSSLAVVFGTSTSTAEPGTVSLYDTTTGSMRSVGSGVDASAPCWSPDSAWIVCTEGSSPYRVARLTLTEDGRKVIAKPGATPKVSRSGTRVAFADTDEPELGGTLEVVASTGGSAVTVRGGAEALSWAWGPDETLYFTRPGDGDDAWELWRANAPDFQGERVGSVTLEAPAFALDDVVVSADGSLVVLAAVGDDSYSRLWIVNTESGRFRAIVTRRDAYPYRWTSDGRVMFFEGNTYQGEDSVLATIKPDGTSKRAVVTGARP